MNRIALFGYPLEYSLSPAMHNAVYEELGLDWVYVPLAVEDVLLVDHAEVVAVAAGRQTVPVAQVEPGARLLVKRGEVVPVDGVLLSAAVITLWRGLALANCGCFGVFLARPLTRQTVLEDVVMLGLSLLVRWQAHRGS